MIAFLRDGWDDVEVRVDGDTVAFTKGERRWYRRRTLRQAALLREELVKAFPNLRFPDCHDLQAFVLDLLSYRSQPPLRSGLPVYFYHSALLQFLFG